MENYCRKIEQKFEKNGGVKKIDGKTQPGLDVPVKK
jgi:hypothetical protein